MVIEVSYEMKNITKKIVELSAKLDRNEIKYADGLYQLKKIFSEMKDKKLPCLPMHVICKFDAAWKAYGEINDNTSLNRFINMYTEYYCSLKDNAYRCTDSTYLYVDHTFSAY